MFTLESSSLLRVFHHTVLLTFALLFCTGIHARQVPSPGQTIDTRDGTFSSPRGRPSSPSSVLGTDEEREDYVQYTAHNYGNIQFTLSNQGFFGITRFDEILDPFTGESVSGCIFPANSGILFGLQGSFYVGCINGYDTLVSAGEFLANLSPLGDFQYRTIDD
jgi:hypothetical protein